MNSDAINSPQKSLATLPIPDDSMRQHIVDVLIHASLALAASDGLAVVDAPGEETYVLSHLRECELIYRTLGLLGVDVNQPLSVREISTDIDFRYVRGSSVPSTPTP
ncbi:hypothetical protein [Pandoraea sputorum]|uniref:hypothetical protein n=1 Tax=Pandoraea sputorum TaxID=93222 RepID=UPI00177C0AE3|nr:hypothetical protein [Pandoraea sputorum]